MAVRVPKRSEIGSSLSRGKSFFCVLLCTSSLYRTEKASMDSRTKKKKTGPFPGQPMSSQSCCCCSCVGPCSFTQDTFYAQIIVNIIYLTFAPLIKQALEPKRWEAIFSSLSRNRRTTRRRGSKSCAGCFVCLFWCCCCCCSCCKPKPDGRTWARKKFYPATPSNVPKVK